MPFFRKSHLKKQEFCSALYKQVVDMARRPEFYSTYDVPDTLDGRFDVLTMHMFLLMRRLKEEKTSESSELSQLLFDLMFKDMDAILRQIGVSDLKVGKEVKSMAKAFLGRVEAYDEALDADDAKDGALETCVQRNVYRSERKVLAANAIADYMHASHIALQAQSVQEIMQGNLKFPCLNTLKD